MIDLYIVPNDIKLFKKKYIGFAEQRPVTKCVNSSAYRLLEEVK